MRLFMILFLSLAGAATADGPAVVSRAPDLDAWLARVDEAGRAAQQDCAARAAAGGAPDGRIWLRAGPDGIGVAADAETSAPALAWWIEATLGARQAAAALFGGDPAALDGLMIEARDGRIAVFDGLRMQQSDLCGAIGRITAAASGATGGGAPVDAARQAVAAGVAAPVGGSAEIALSGLDFSGEAVLRGPDGVAAEIGPVGADGTARAVVSPQPGAKPGPGVLRVYARDDPFRPRAEIALRVLPGAAPPAPAAVALAPGGTARGALAVGGEAVLTLDITQPGALTLRSDGAQDLRARLETVDGRLLGADDDAPGGYGFRIAAQLGAGSYRLRISHCCGGGGGFVVIADPR